MAPRLREVPNRVKIINSTFALNQGHTTLGYDGSQIYNSIIWKDDAASDTLTQIEVGTTLYDNGDDTAVGNNNLRNNAVFGLFGDDDGFGNQSLISNNKDVFFGPNFVDPMLGVTTYSELSQRNFHINPSVRTMNMADTTLYKQHVFVRQYPLVAQEKYFKRAIGLKHDAKSIGDDIDLSGKSRLHGESVERGAYECQAILQRVLYVQPTMPSAMSGDGSLWVKPFGQGELQNAIDVAAVYTYLNSQAAEESRRSYVFVKGSYDAMAEEPIIARDGVQVYGGLPNRFNDTVWLNKTTMAYENAECARFVNQVRAQRNGVASPDANSTKIKGLIATGEDFGTGFLLDGFQIIGTTTNENDSAVVLNENNITLRNCLITANQTGQKPIVDLRKGLLYNSLIYGNSADTIIKVGANGLMLNCTVGSEEGQIAIDSTTTTSGNIQNTINGGKMYVPYFSSKNAFTLPQYLTSNPVLSFQLHEQSQMIDAGNENLPSQFDYYTTNSYINFLRDRDVLGNPRRLFNKVDRGAMETWKINQKEVIEITSLTNTFLTEDQIVNSTNEQLYNSFTEHYGGNMYPHTGSVVYLMDSSAMTMAYSDANDFNEIILRPGYMLLKPAASFYGNGHQVQMDYLAAEKRFTNQRYSMTAFPFDYYTNNITSTIYDEATDSVGQILNPLTINWYQYSGAARSTKDYHFTTANSASWLSIDTLHRTATEGYLMDMLQTTDTMLRFTAFAEQLGEYVYQEQSDDKTILLTQHDSRIINNDNTIHFTRSEDMGWNMKGLPWLVSNYRTDTILEEGNYVRQMYIPHVFYQMDGAGTYLTQGDQVYTSRSWDKGSTLSMGNAFLTQTATQQDKETIIFHLPYYSANEKASRPIIRLSNRTLNKSDILTIMPDSTADKKVNYSYGRDGVKWQGDNSNFTQVYLLDHRLTSRLSLLGSAPIEVDIPLGVNIAANNGTAHKQVAANDGTAHKQVAAASSTAEYTFDLPERESLMKYKYVWLIDYKLNRIINLLQDNYTVELEQGENRNRFAVRIGGYPLTDAEGNRKYIIFAYNGNLYVRGVVAGDNIKLYSPTGQLMLNTTSQDGEFTTPLPYRSGYVVKVNDYTKKVVNL